MNLTTVDKAQLEEKGITEKQLQEQIAIFERGIPHMHLTAPASIGNGIVKLTEEQVKSNIQYFENKSSSLELLKFVPASGAASRMFKSFFKFLSDFNPDRDRFATYIERNNAGDIAHFFDNIKALPFYDRIINKMNDKNEDDNHFKWEFIRLMLTEEGLNFGNYPKGLLPFHSNGAISITAFEEHLYEAAYYSSSKRRAKLHFTISEDHKEKFLEEYKRVKAKVEDATRIVFDVSFSFQKSSTDTVAVNLDNTLFRNKDRSLLFRPSGHGALIENLSDQDADIIFIKNIDNVVVSKYREDISNAKKMLAGLLLNVQEKAFFYAKELSAKVAMTDEKLAEIKSFLENELNVVFPTAYNAYSISESVSFLLKSLRKPIRICGMVKNEGEPGGGPFWVKDAEGNISLQIVESAQIDKNNPAQNEILKNATHFNPVDLVCAIRDFEGNRYTLNDFVDKEQGFITQKTSEGKDLKALELPGLWNGAMAHWNTIFVEVPLLTFNPVKTVVDLLKPAHQF